jgi:hypothetical protein
MFKVFRSVAPFAWNGKINWYTDKRDQPWEIFLPCLASCNKRRRKLTKTLFLILDESIPGWRPKPSKLGGLPNFTFEPQKPVPLGTMFKN